MKAPCSPALPLTLSTGARGGRDLPLQVTLSQPGAHWNRSWISRWVLLDVIGCYWALLPRCPTSHASTWAANLVWETVHLARLTLLLSSALESNQVFKAAVALLMQPWKWAQARTLQEKADSCCLTTQLKMFGCLRHAYRHFPDKCKKAKQKTSIQCLHWFNEEIRVAKAVTVQYYLIINYLTCIN